MARFRHSVETEETVQWRCRSMKSETFILLWDLHRSSIWSHHQSFRSNFGVFTPWSSNTAVKKLNLTPLAARTILISSRFLWCKCLQENRVIVFLKSKFIGCIDFKNIKNHYSCTAKMNSSSVGEIILILSLLHTECICFVKISRSSYKLQRKNCVLHIAHKDFTSSTFKEFWHRPHSHLQEQCFQSNFYYFSCWYIMSCSFMM